MDFDIATIVLVVTFLPGLLGASLFYYLRGAKPSLPGLIVFSVFLSIAGNYLAEQVGLVRITPTAISQNSLFSEFVFAWVFWVSLFACAIAFLLLGLDAGRRHVLEHHVFQRLLFGLGLSESYSQESMWDFTMRTQAGRWVRLHYKDGRVIRGWVDKFSHLHEPRSLFLRDAALLPPPRRVGKVTVQPESRDLGYGLLLIDLAEIEFYEFERRDDDPPS